MATSAKGSKPTVKVGSKRPDHYSYPIPVEPVFRADAPEDHMMGAVGWIVSVVLVALMLPLLAFMLLDTLEQKQEVRQQLEKVEKLRREIEKIERKNRDKTPASITDNPVFDRVRRPL